MDAGAANNVSVSVVSSRLGFFQVATVIFPPQTQSGSVPKYSCTYHTEHTNVVGQTQKEHTKDSTLRDVYDIPSKVAPLGLSLFSMVSSQSQTNRTPNRGFRRIGNDRSTLQDDQKPSSSFLIGNLPYLDHECLFGFRRHGLPR